jgi:phospholipase D1/2
VNRPGNTPGDRRLERFSIVRLSALGVLITATAAAGYLLNGWLDPLAEVRGWVNRAGSAGPLLFVLFFLALNTVGVPLPVLGAAAGVAFGPIPGATTSLVAMTITACVQFLLARYVVGERVRQRLGDALVRVSQLLERRGVIAVAGARLLPGPFSEFNMLAGLTVLTLRDFTIGTVIGCAPKALAWSGIGALV